MGLASNFFIRALEKLNRPQSNQSPRPIRVGILGTQGIPAGYGGFETFAEELATRWSEDEKFEITVVCPGPRQANQPLFMGRVRLDYVPEPKVGPFTNVAFDLRCLWAHRRSFDILYMLGYGAAFACALPRAWGTQVWINMDGMEWQRSKWGWAIQRYLRLMEWVSTKSANRLIADADAIKAYLLESYGTDLACSFIPYGANAYEPGEYPYSLLPEGLEPNRYFLVVARLEPENQIMEILEGFLSSSAQEPLIVVGNIQYGNLYVQRLLRLQSDRVRFLGGIYDKPTLATLRCHAKAYFHGHTVGGTNPSLLEALSAGRPIIAHDNLFNREVAADLATYFRTSSDIQILLKEESFLKFLPEVLLSTCHIRIHNYYNWGNVADTYKLLALKELHY